MSETESATNTVIRMAMSSGKTAGSVVAAGMYLTAVALQGIGATLRGMYHVAQWAKEHRPEIEDKGEMSIAALRDKHEHVHVSPALDSEEFEHVAAKLKQYEVDFAVEQVEGVTYIHMSADDVDIIAHAIEAADAEISALEAKETEARAAELDQTIEDADRRIEAADAKIGEAEHALDDTRADFKEFEKKAKARYGEIKERAGGARNLDAYLDTPEGHTDNLRLEADGITHDRFLDDIGNLEQAIEETRSERSRAIGDRNAAATERAELLGQEPPARLTDPDRAADLDKKIAKLEREQASWSQLAEKEGPGYITTDGQVVDDGPGPAAQNVENLDRQIAELKAERDMIGADGPAREGETIAKDGQVSLDAEGLEKTGEQTALTRDNTSPSKAGDKQAKGALDKRKAAAKKEPKTSERASGGPAKTTGAKKPPTPPAHGAR